LIISGKEYFHFIEFEYSGVVGFNKEVYKVPIVKKYNYV